MAVDLKAFKPAAGYLGVAVTHGAADFLAHSVAIGLAPIRVNAISPGVVDKGIWDACGEQDRTDCFEHFPTHNPATRIGSTNDIAEAVLLGDDRRVSYRNNASRRQRGAADMTDTSGRSGTASR